jgi:hypothetical protein
MRLLNSIIGGSAIMAAEVLISRGVPEERILFLNLIASPEGINNFANKFPKLRVVTAFVDQGLDEKKYVSCLIFFLDTNASIAILFQGLAILVTDSTPCKLPRRRRQENAKILAL